MRLARHSSDSPLILRVDCIDRPGLIHVITGVLSRHGVNIVTNDEFVDDASGRFFMRTAFVGGKGAREDLRRELEDGLPPGATVTIRGGHRPRVVVLATREHHCLGELLLRHAHGELGATIDAVVSNRDVLRELTDRFGVPFVHVPHEGRSREAHERALLDVLGGYAVDHLVLGSTWPLPRPYEELCPDARHLAELRAGLPATAEELATWFFPEDFLRTRPELRRMFAGARPASARSVRRGETVRTTLERGVADIVAPTLVLAGELDRVVPPSITLSMAGRIRSADAVLLPGVGHVTALQVPQVLAQHILRFLRPEGAQP